MYPLLQEIQKKFSLITSMMYFDDMIFACNDETKLREGVEDIKKIIQDYGFELNEEKCVFKPQRSIDFLGFHVSKDWARLADKSANNAELMLENFLKRPTVGSYASLMGLLGFAAQLDPALKCHVSHLKRICDPYSVHTKGNRVHLKPDEMKELKKVVMICKENKFKFNPALPKHFVTKEIYVDAVHGMIGASNADKVTQRTMSLKDNQIWGAFDAVN
jgi:hypothetical protein